MGKKKVAIIGGGASGFFTAINLAEQSQDFDITIYEASSKLLSKVLISGGGRCNVTNRISDPDELSRYYPRGGSFLETSFKRFSSNDTRDWFAKRGVETKVEEDGRVFPISDSSESIYAVLTNEARKNGVEVKRNHRLVAMEQLEDKWKLKFKDVEIDADVLVLGLGISKAIKTMLESSGVHCTDLVPSLFTFNCPSNYLKHLSGVAAKNVSVSIKEIPNSNSSGPLLITHWGFSAPSVLKLSAKKAIEINALDYEFTLVINWLPDATEKETLEALKIYAEQHPKKKVLNYSDERLPKRLWQGIIEQLELQEFTNWAELGKKRMLKLVRLLHAYETDIQGKTTFKEEFVTAGGINLDNVNNNTFEVTSHTNLYAVGEVLNVDGVTGGFNFQAAWTGAYLAAESIRLTASN